MKWRLVLGAALLGALAWVTGASPAGGRAEAAEGVELRSLTAAPDLPRPLEEPTRKALERDYRAAWGSLEAALASNQSSALAENFTGQALEQWQQAVTEQSRHGLSRRIVDHGHALEVTFYSPDGSSLIAHDRVELEIEYRERDKALTSGRESAEFLVLMTPAENNWKIRILQQRPVQP